MKLIVNIHKEEKEKKITEETLQPFFVIIF